MKKYTNSRRVFLKKSLTSVAGITIIPRHVLGGKGIVPPSDRVNVAIIGCGGQSYYSVRELFKLDDTQIVAIADPAYIWKNDILYREDTGRGPAKKIIEDFYTKKQPVFKVAEYEDFRQMLEKEKSIDAVVCATPDNTHAYVSVTSMRTGKHVYCEKPLTHNLWEARKVRDVARETGLATQMGNQLHNTDANRTTVEYLRAGVIGKIREAHSWVSTSRWLPTLAGFPSDTSPVPEGFKWDLWLGPTSFRPFNKVYTPVKWRDFWAFGCGALGDFGCHDMDTVTWALNLKNPQTVEVIPGGNKGSSDIAPYAEIGYYNFTEDGEQQPVKLTWYSGGLKPPSFELIPSDVKLAGRGAIFIGDKGLILNNGGASSAPLIFPDSHAKSVKLPEKTIPRTKGHHREWIDAIKGGPAPLSNFDYASRLTEITLLGVLSLRLGGSKIFWDADNLKAKGLPEADNIIKEPVRAGWEMK